jgi:carboxyl-terminal processing protease
MPRQSSKKSHALPLILLAATLPALFIGARAAGPPPERMGTYAEILSLIQERHVPDAAPKDTIYASIHGMLSTLDPHTNFLDDEVYREMREEQRGHFYGLGIVISKRGRHEPLRVVAPISDTPASRLGMRSGDVITHIRDGRAGVDVDTVGLTLQEAVKYLRGPRGTAVEVTVDRPGLDEPLVLEIERDAVRTPAVKQTFMIRPGIGYLRIANFTETTMTELDEALAQLEREGAEKLILDLQNNPGGLLDQAVGMASRFLEPGELVVYTEGRQPGSRQDYAALRDVTHERWPMVVLVDRGSASASEIVAGAIQDHDRGIIVGETTFGKGLVQSVYPLSENTGLALTTQKYYSPSGRSIQRPYSSEEEYYFEAMRREESEDDDGPDGPVYRTDIGRTVYGGGGIAPDIEVPAPEQPELLMTIARASGFSRFVDPLSDERRQQLSEDDAALFDAFVAFVRGELDAVDPERLGEIRPRLLDQLHAELALSAFGMDARDRVLIERSPVVQRAIEALDQAEELLAKRRQTRSDEQARARTRPRAR